jgi:murein DD-endopeptidase MepM/ murein hydrolase activator NlpD
MLRKILSILFAALIAFIGLSQPAFAYVSRVPQTNGQPNWTQISFNNMGTVQSDNLGILDDLSLIQQLGYNPSRAYSVGDNLSSILKVGDLDVFGLGNKSVGSFLGGVNPNNVSLGEFEAINGVSFTDLSKSVNGLSKIPVSSFPLLQSVISGNRSGIAQNLSPFLQQVSPEVKDYLKANPWAADLPLEQVLQGDWKGAALQGTLKVGLPKLVKQFPSLKNVPLGDIVSAASTGNLKAIANVGIQYGIKYGLKQLNQSVGDFLKDNPQLADLPIGMLTDINKLSINSVPGLTKTAISSIPGLKNQTIKNVPGLENVPLSSLLGLLTAAFAKVDLTNEGDQEAPRALTGGGYSFTSTPCTGPACSNFEVNQAQALNPLLSSSLNGLQFVVGSNDSKKGQSVKGGKGILGKMFGGKEPVHIRPWGDDPNISMAVLSVNDVKGDAQLGFYLRICAQPPLMPKTCTPYAIGPIPFMTVHEGETVVIQSTNPPPISSPTLSGYSNCGGTSTPTKYGHKPYAESSDNLVPITVGGVATGRTELLKKDAAASFEKMRADAQAKGINLYGISGFRDVASQTQLWNQQVAKLGSPQQAATVSAPPGYSEHHTGYAVDLGTNQSTDLSPSFEYTPAYAWLSQNASKYGFQQSFTGQPGQGAGKESWHFRFTGSSQANTIFNPPSSSISSSGSNSKGGMQLYLARIAEGESSGGVNLGPNYLGAYGKYQFIPSTRAAILQKYGHDAWNPSQWDAAAIDLIGDVGGQKVINAINAGDFTYADQVLNTTWTSLPGGAEDNWTAAKLAQFGGVTGGSGATLVASNTSCGGVQCPPNGPCLLHHPLPPGVITSGFGQRNGRLHAGVDIAELSGSTGPGGAVLSAADGQVVAIPNYFSGCGNYGYRIEVEHPGRNLYTTYNHLYSRNVQVGSKVARGQQIAVEGATSCGMYTHLHFETQKTAGIGVAAGVFDPTTLQYDPVMK